jgi:hypothetical protein
MRYRADKFSNLRFQTLPINVLLVIISLPIYLTLRTLGGLRDGFLHWLGDVDELYQVFVKGEQSVTVREKSQ